MVFLKPKFSIGLLIENIDLQQNYGNDRPTVPKILSTQTD